VKIAVVILAGGEGSRIGGAKPLRVLRGKRLIDRAEALARQWSDIIAVAVREPAQAGDTRATPIFDEAGIDGPLAGLAAALRFAGAGGCEAALTIASDMPFLPPDLGKRLSIEIEDAKAAIASSGGRLHPVCGMWRVSALDAIADYLISGRRSLRGFAEAVGFRAVEWSADRDPFFNINSAEDLAEAERRFAP
jgi:molybdopterin-guanine dinucleotide biosynthesis protein A